MQRRGFTLIELLVVIAIIGILATLVITQLGAARVKARNSAARSDVTEMGKAIEVYKNNFDDFVFITLENASGVTSTSGDTLNSTTNDNFTGIFASGNTNANYPVAITRTPSTSYTYVYRTTQTTPAQTVNNTAASSSGVGYLVGTSLVAEGTGGSTDTAFYLLNGTAISGTAAIPAAS